MGELQDFRSFLENIVNEAGQTLQTFSPVNPHRTSTIKTTFDDPILPIQTARRYEYSETTNTEYVKTNNIFDKDVDNMYNMMFYGEEDNVNNVKKADLDTTYEDKIKINVEFVITTENDLERVNSSRVEALLESEYIDDSDINITTKNPYLRVFGAVTESSTELPKSKRISDKPRPACNLITIRESNFNSLRTLPEVVFINYFKIFYF
jgi:hypothetical protein